MISNQLTRRLAHERNVEEISCRRGGGIERGVIVKLYRSETRYALKAVPSVRAAMLTGYFYMQEYGVTNFRVEGAGEFHSLVDKVFYAEECKHCGVILRYQSGGFNVATVERDKAKHLKRHQTLPAAERVARAFLFLFLAALVAVVIAGIGGYL
jgi:hypothetical protein